MIARANDGLAPLPQPDENLYESSILTDDVVASLLDLEILQMSRAELIRVIKDIRHSHLRPELPEQLPHLEHGVLVRLTFLTRRFCRNRVRGVTATLAG